MRIFTTIPSCRNQWEFSTVLTLGTFDGVHLGHGYIIDEVVRRARSQGDTSVVLTFDRHPLSVLRPTEAPGLLTSVDEKCSLFEKHGVDIVIIIPFTREISRYTGEEFIRDYLLECLKIKEFIVGYDHGFGRNRAGSADTFRHLARDLSFSFTIIEPVEVDGVIIKSSTIREEVRQGAVAKAARYLGREYSLRGTVVQGKGLGRQIGIPTANVQPEDNDKIIPAHGVYSGLAVVGGLQRRAVISIGPRPTFGIEEIAVEAHLVDFSEDIYGESIEVRFSRRLRGIEKYSSREELIHQIKKDIELSDKLNES